MPDRDPPASRLLALAGGSQDQPAEVLSTAGAVTAFDG
jgi:hypothetical protein